MVNAAKESNQAGLLNMKKQTMSRRESSLPWDKHMVTKHELRGALRTVGAGGRKFTSGQNSSPGGDCATLLCSQVMRGSVPSGIPSALLSKENQIEWTSPGGSPNPLYIKEKKAVKYSA